MFSRNQLFRPIITSCLSKMAELKRTRPTFRDKSFRAEIRVQPEVNSQFVNVEHKLKTKVDPKPYCKSISWYDLLNRGNNCETEGVYSEALKCYKRIIREANNDTSLLTASQKDLLINAYVRVADITYVDSEEDEYKALRLLDKALKLDSTNLAAFDLKRSILADRYEDISPAAVLRATSRK